MEVRGACADLRRIVTNIYGPHASNAFIQRKGGPFITNDGSTIIRELESPNRMRSVVEQIIRQAVIKTNQDCGDGTTTTAILVIGLLEEGLRTLEAETATPLALNYLLQKAAKEVCCKLDQISRPVEDEKDLIQLAMIASKGDRDLSVALASASMEVGEEGFISIEEGKSSTIQVQHKTGLIFPTVPCSYSFLPEGHKVLEGCLVATLKTPLKSFDDIRGLLECASQWQQNPLLIVTTSFISGPALDTIILNNAKNVTDCSVLHIAEDPHNRKETLRDLASLCGSEVVDPKQGLQLDGFKAEWFGTLRKVTIDRSQTKAIAYTEDAGGSSWIEARIQELNSQMSSLEYSGSVDRCKRRIAQLDEGLCVIEVGGFTDSEIKNRFSASEDALNILRSALKFGVVMGGGNTLATIMEDDSLNPGEKILQHALRQPLRILMEKNRHYGLPEIDLHAWRGYDCLEGVVRDLWEDPKIMTPTEVLKQAILNATSVAGTILLSEQVILK